jgi:hypothetical protein
VGMITRPEESYLCGVSECNREASTMRRPWPTRGSCAMGEKLKMFRQLTVRQVLTKLSQFLNMVYLFW